MASSNKSPLRTEPRTRTKIQAQTTRKMYLPCKYQHTKKKRIPHIDQQQMIFAQCAREPYRSNEISVSTLCGQSSLGYLLEGQRTILFDDISSRWRGQHGTGTGVRFEQRIKRRRRRRWRRWRRWLPRLSAFARFMARRTTTPARSPPFPLRHITRQTYASPNTVRKNGSAQSVHLTSPSTRQDSVERLPRALHHTSYVLLRRIYDVKSSGPQRISVVLVKLPADLRAEVDRGRRSKTGSSQGVILHRTLHRPGRFPVIGTMPYVDVTRR